MAPTSFSEAAQCLGWDLLYHVSGLGGGGGGAKKVAATALSPMSVIMAVSLLAGAADPDRKAAWASRLRVSSSLLAEAQALQAQAATQGGSSLSLANAVFVDGGTELYPAYTAYVESLGAVVRQYPSIPGAVDDINRWISQGTDGRIDDMLSAAALRGCHAVLVNALAFKGTWKVKFDRAATRPGYDFILEDGTRRPVDMMFLRGQMVGTARGHGYTAVRLPYTAADGGAAPYLIAYLPDEGVALQSLAKRLSGDAPRLSFRMQKYTQLGLPKFRVESGFSLLKELGRAGLDVNGGYPEMGKGDNVVSDIFHNTFVVLDEEGTEAAAATAVMMTRSRPIVEPVDVLIFNRPFLYSIHSGDAGVPVMCGTFSVV